MTDARRSAAFTDARIEMAHGAGGQASRRLVEGPPGGGLCCASVRL